MIFARALNVWKGFTSGSINRRIFHAMAVIAVATVGVKAAAMIKDMIVAGKFGLGDDLDAFLIALVVPTFATAVLAQAFIGAFMPAFIRVREQEGEARARRIFAHVMLLDLLILLAAAALLAVFGLPILRVLAPEFSASKLELTHELYMILLPMVVLTGQCGLWGAVLNAGEKFALVALAPIATPLLIVALLIAVGADITAVAWGTVLGAAVELVVIGVTLARRGLFPLPRWHRDRSATAEVLRHYVPLMASTVIMSGAGVVDQAMASWLGSGAVAALSFGNKIPSFLTAIGVSAIGTAVLPHFSRLIAVGDHASLRHVLRTYAFAILALSVPVTAALIVGSEWIIAILFQRGAFTRDDTSLVAFIQQMYFLQVPFFMLGMLGVRLLLATSRTYLITAMSVVNLAVNVVGNLVFMRWLGVSGIALSSAVVYMVSMTMIWILVRRYLAESDAQGGPGEEKAEPAAP
ncbi:MAG TPA: lipid II flippase MurJ [Burkholderiales bacterium]|nr:lipid II flippase MurJ [Burkholderiales bacterium]